MAAISTCGEVREEGVFLWYYDQIEKRCLATSDCISNENRFESEPECQATCVPKSRESHCPLVFPLKPPPPQLPKSNPVEG